MENSEDSISLYKERLMQMEPIRHDYHSQKEKTIQTIVASIAGFSAFVFSLSLKVKDMNLSACIIFFLFICVVYIYAAIFLNKQIYLKRGVAAQVAAIFTDLWMISNKKLKAEDIGLTAFEAEALIGNYGITGSASSIQYWSKSYSNTVKKSFQNHTLKNTDTVLLCIMILMSLLSISNFLLLLFNEKFDYVVSISVR